MSKTEKYLIDAGFKIITKHTDRWFTVTSPDGETGAVLRQSFAAWHFFSKRWAATASNSQAKMCHRGGLGDAISTDSQMRTYKKLLTESNVPKSVRSYEGVYAAMQQV